MAGFGIVLGIISTIVSLAAVWLLAMMALATHPV